MIIYQAKFKHIFQNQLKREDRNILFMFAKLLLGFYQ